MDWTPFTNLYGGSERILWQRHLGWKNGDDEHYGIKSCLFQLFLLILMYCLPFFCFFDCTARRRRSNAVFFIPGMGGGNIWIPAVAMVLFCCCLSSFYLIRPSDLVIFTTPEIGQSGIRWEGKLVLSSQRCFQKNRLPTWFLFLFSCW